MKILITGGSGFLGKRAAMHFAALGHQVLVPSHSQLDITDPDGVEHWFRENRPQAVLHCAAVSDTAACQKDPEGSALVNVQGSLNLAAACHSIGAKFVFCSSDQVYANSELPGPHKETELLQPKTVYGQQKLLAEQLCQQKCRDTVSLRLTWMYGDQRLPGEHGHLLSTLRAAIQDPKMPFSFPIYDKRGITNVQAVVQNLPLALDFPPGVYNFGAENDRSTYHTIHAALEASNLKEPLARLYINSAAFAENPRDIRMDTGLACSLGACFDTTLLVLCRAVSVTVDQSTGG